MAKPKAVKVKDRFDLQDKINSGKLFHATKVCLLVRKHPEKHRVSKQFGFVRGWLTATWHTRCECCGPEFVGSVKGADGKIKWKFT